MLVSHTHKFIYTKTVKTGGTSVESYFEKFCMRAHEWQQKHGRSEYESDVGIIGFRGGEIPRNCKWWNHMPAALIKQGVGEEVWARYTKFCVVRNPFEKAISAYYFFRTGTAIDITEDSVHRDRADFEAWLHQGTGLPIDRDKYLIDGVFCLDSVVRYESLEADLASICAKLSIAWSPAGLPRFKKGVRPQFATVQSLFTKRSREIVATAFAYELDRFGYSFPSEG